MCTMNERCSLLSQRPGALILWNWNTQATQNGSDLWLSYWVSHEHKQRLRLADAVELGGRHMHLGLGGQPGPTCGQAGTLLGLTWAWDDNCAPLRCKGPVCVLRHLCWALAAEDTKS